MADKIISLDKAINTLENEFWDSPYLSGSRVAMVCNVLRRVPEADVVPVRHSTWEGGYVFDKKIGWCYRPPFCSLCKRESREGKSEFCPHCGAMMDGDEDV